MDIQVYTDGSATTKDKPGGYAWVLVLNGTQYSEGYGHLEKATNNDAELEAAIKGLEAAFVLSKGHISALSEYSPQVKVTLVSDSQIVLGWANGSFTFRQEDKMHKFKALKLLVNLMKVQTRWVEGHSGERYNERCDALANFARSGKPKTKKRKKEPIDQKTFNDIVNKALQYVNSTGAVSVSTEWVDTLSHTIKTSLENDGYKILKG